MDQRNPPEYTIEVFADAANVRHVLKGILHTIFFHRYFPTIRPSTIEVLSLTLPWVPDPTLENLIETRAGQITRQLTQSPSPSSHPPPPPPSPSSTAHASHASKSPSPFGAFPNTSYATLTITFYEKKRRKAGTGLGWFGTISGARAGTADEEVCWERWRVEVGCVRGGGGSGGEGERERVRREMERGLLRAVMRVVEFVDRGKEHIPPITTSESNPFPYRIEVGRGGGR